MKIMKRIIVLFFLFLATIPANAKTQFVFAFEAQELFPYFMGNTSDIIEKNPGATIEMIKLLENNLPIKISFSRHSWKRNLLDLKDGKVDGIVSSYKPDRLEFGVYPMENGKPDPEKSLDISNYHLYVMAGAGIVWSPERLKFTGVEKPIGTPYGYSIAALLKKTKVRVDEYGNATENLTKLVAGRLSGAALLEFDADRILFHGKEKFPGVVKLDPPLISKYYYLMMSHQFYKKYNQLSEKIWDACVKIRRSHREKILMHYLQMGD